MSVSLKTRAELYKKMVDKAKSGEFAGRELYDLHNYTRFAYPVAYDEHVTANKTDSDKQSSVQSDISVENDKTTAITPEYSGAASNDVYTAYKDMLEAASSAQSSVKKDIEAYIDTLNDKFDSLLVKLDEGNYKDYELYDDIVAEYTALGEKMAHSAVAEAASSNSGNMDTLGAANAHRQVLAYKNAGETAAKDAYNDSIEQYAEGLSKYASDITDAYSLLSQSADRLDDYGLSILDSYNDYQNIQLKLLEAVGDGGVFDRSGELDSKNMTNRLNQYMSMLMALYPSYSEEIQSIFHPI